MTGPWSELWPSESFSRNFNWQIESKGMEPVSCWFDKSSCVIWLFGLQVTPAKLQREFVGCQEVKKLVVVVVGVWREVLRFRRSWRSVVEWLGEKRERRESSERKWRREAVVDDMVERLGNVRGFRRWFDERRMDE